jgi:HemK-related putative methylase
MIVSKIAYKNVSVEIEENVYEPAEDTFLLADCTVSVLSEFIKQKDKNDLKGLEVGCGSGFVSKFAEHYIPALQMIGLDINPNAVLCTCGNGIRAYRSDMFDIFDNKKDGTVLEAALESKLGLEKPAEGFDVILFNPPYLPTSADEKIDGWINYAFDGGPSGRESIDRFLASAGNYLTEGGIILMLISSLTGIEEVSGEFEKNGFFAEPVGETKIDFEKLFVLKGKRI